MRIKIKRITSLVLNRTLLACAFAGVVWTAPVHAQFHATFYGDSRGQLVSAPFWGWVPDGWNTYLKVGNPAVQWQINNQAVVAKTAAFLNNELLVNGLLCNDADSDPFNNCLPMAGRVAYEIGGNDAIFLGPVGIFCPFCIPAAVDYISGQQRLTAKLLKLNVAARGYANDCVAENPENPIKCAGDRVLFMGNFPAVARGPISGTVKQQCPTGICNWGTMLNPDSLAPITAQEIAQYPFWNADLRKRFVNSLKLEAARQLVVASAFYDRAHGIIERMGLLPDWAMRWFARGGRVCASGVWLLDLYCEWINWWTEGDSTLTTMPSMLMWLAHLREGQMAAEEQVNYLNMWFRFVRWDDCLAGTCWTAPPSLFTDLIHINWIGYTMWGQDLGIKLTQIGWTNTEPLSGPDLSNLTGPLLADLEITLAAARLGMSTQATGPVESLIHGKRYRQLYHNPITNVHGALYWRDDRDAGKRVSLVWGGHWYPYHADGAHEGRWGYPDYGAAPCDCGVFNDCGGFQFENGYAMWHPFTGTAMIEGAMAGCPASSRVLH